MTAQASNTPISVDYTGRDYYALREQLIARVQDRVPTWTGTDASDFGLALVESFAYMGDLLNYYIDRVANESFLLTATQRESILNIAQMYGYRPANYVSAFVDLTITNNAGYLGAIGAAVIESGDLGGDLGPNGYAKIIVPNDHPFQVDDLVIVRNIPETLSGTLGGSPVKYAYSAFNGTFPVVYNGYDNYGNNVIWYRPSATAVAVSPSSLTGTVTAATGNGTLITYTASNTLVAGSPVTISGLSTSSGSSLNISSAEVVSATSTQFTVASTLVGVSSGTGAFSSSGFSVTLSDVDKTLVPIGKYTISGVSYPGQKIILSNVPGYNGTWEVFSASVDGQSFRVNLPDNAHVIRRAVDLGTEFVYSAWGDLIVSQPISIKGVKSANNTDGADNTHFNFNSTTITDVKKLVGGVSRITHTPSSVTFYLEHALEAGDLVSFSDNAPSGLNYQDVSVTSVADVTSNIIGVTPYSGFGPGNVTFTTQTNHSFKTGDFVTITGVSPADYNMVSAKITHVPNLNEFVVEAYWEADVTSTDDAVATVHTATITDNLNVDATAVGRFVCWQFKVSQGSNADPGAWATSTSAKVTPVVSGTPTLGSTAEVNYADLPAVILSGAGEVLNVADITAGDVTVPAGSQVTTQVSVDGGVKTVVFSTTADLVVPYRDSGSISAVHGEDVSLRTENAAVPGGHDINGELLGFSTGGANQGFSLKEVQVAPRSVRVFVDTGTIWEEWSQVEHTQDYGPLSKVFQVNVAANETVYVNFGDGISGSIPNPDSGIKAVYIAGGGSLGNVGAGTLTSWGTIPGSNALDIRTNMTVTNNQAATGGVDPESNDSIRYNAPKALRALNRAVTLEDFSNLCLSVDGVGKAKAVGSSRSSVTVYIAPVSPDNSGDLRPGYDSGGTQTPYMTQLLTQAADYLSDKKQIGTTVTILPPTYVDVEVGISYSAMPQYSQDLVSTAIKKAVLDGFSYNNLALGDVITPEEVEFNIRQVEGVANAKVTTLCRRGGSGRNSIVASDDELFVFREKDGDTELITLTPRSTDASLSAVSFATASSTSLIPAFNPSVYSYNVTFASGTTGTKVTPIATSHSDASVSDITVNDKKVTSGSASENIPLGAATGAVDTIIVSVTAPDGVTVKTYKFKVTIAA